MRTSTRTGFWRAVLAALLLLSMALTACDEEEEEGGAPPQAQPVSSSQAQPVSSPQTQPTKRAYPARQGRPGTWLVMLYQDADDETLEEDIFIDFNEAELVGSSENVTIVAQLDRFAAGFGGGGNLTGARRYLVTKDEDLRKIGSKELANLGKIDMGNKDTLVAFATWAMETYPAQRYALILSDHGMGWLGGWTDDDPHEGSQMTMNDIDQALQEIVQQTGVGQLDLVGFDACLMAQMEVLSACAPHAHYAVASEETEPALGWAYAAFLGALTENPTMDGAGLAKAIVASYIDQDIRVVNATERKVLVEEAFGIKKEYSAAAVAEAMGEDVTLTAVDLAQMSALNGALNNLALALAAANPKGVAAARSYAQAYEDVFGKKSEPSYIDLGHFAALAAKETGDAAVTAAANALKQQLAATILAEKHGPKRPGSTGLSIFFPNSALYKRTLKGNLSYVLGASRFAAASLWDDFLTAFYAGGKINAASADLAVLKPAFPVQDTGALAASSQPAAGAQVASPVSGGVSVAPLVLSTDEIPSDGSLTISTVVSGANVAFIYIYTAYYDEDEGAYLTADIDYIAADGVKQVGDVTYPDWGAGGKVPIEIDWEPTLYYLSNGDESKDDLALFDPQVYGATAKEDVYVVYGEYKAGGKGQAREAMLEFDGNGDMRRLLVFTASGEAGAPRQVAPKPGDTFTVWLEWLEYDEGEEDWLTNYYAGGTVTFGKSPLTMVPYSGYAGQYQVGIVVQDLDGNLVAEYADVIVTD